MLDLPAALCLTVDARPAWIRPTPNPSRMDGKSVQAVITKQATWARLNASANSDGRVDRHTVGGLRLLYSFAFYRRSDSKGDIYGLQTAIRY